MIRALVSFVLVWAVSGVAVARDDQRPVPRGAAPSLEMFTQAFSSFEARDLAGRLWRASDLEGRVVLLDFWATWCAPCLADVPWIRQARERFAVSRFVVIGVSLDTTDRRTLTAWLNRQRVDWPQLWDDRGFDGRLARRFGVETLPRSILFDARGRAVATDLRGEQLLARLTKLLP